MMNILVLNSGSSSLKYRLLRARRDGTLEERTGGIVERIGEGPVRDHGEALGGVLDGFLAGGLLAGPGDLSGIGHRVVHGGDRFRDPALVDAAVLDAIREMVPFAPLHNPVNLLGIEVARRLCPGVPQVAVFDTAFHQTLPAPAFLYALPYEAYERHGIRRYGFHGTSHAYVSRRAIELLGRPAEETSLVTLHLGNGASAAAVRGGRAVETSMGLTPLEGLVMGTRSGDLDPAVVFHLARHAGMAWGEIEHMLERESGLKGLAGANDMREVLARAEAGDPRARLALEVYVHRIRKYVGAYVAVLGGLDALVFTGGVGENASAVRALVCRGLGCLGLEIDVSKNCEATGEADVATEGSRARILVVRTNEELEIARQTLRCLRAAEHRQQEVE